MPKAVLKIQATRRVMTTEDDFFLSGNFERYKAFLHRAQVRAADLTSNDCTNEYDMQSISTNHIVCVEVGCNQMFSSLKKVRFFRGKRHT